MKTLTIVIPFFNEGDRILKTIRSLKKGFNCHGIKLDQLFFVNDGSTDSTFKTLSANKKILASALGCKVNILSYPRNKGRGYAIRISSLIASSDFVLYTDADLSIPLENLINYKQLLDRRYDLIFGSKKKPGAIARCNRGIIRNTVGYCHSVIASIVLGVTAWDYQGGFKIFSKKLIKEVFPSLTLDRWGFDMEIIYLAKKLGYNDIEIPVVWDHVEKGSKVKLIRDIVQSLADMIHIRRNWFAQNYVSSSISYVADPYFSKS